MHLRIGEPRVSLLILASGLWIGGAEVVIRNLIQAIDRRRVDLSVACLKGLGPIGLELVQSGQEIVDLSCPARRDGRVDYFTFRRVAKLVSARRIDVVHTHTVHGLVDASLSRLFRPCLKIVHTFHFGNYPHIQPRVLHMERVALRFAHRLCAVGEVQRRQIKAVHRLSDHQIQTVWNGVTLPDIEGGTGTAPRNRLGCSEGLLVGTVATFIEQKGLLDLLDVARRVHDARRAVTFVIVGDGHLRPVVEARRRELGLEDRVVLTGWLPNAAQAALPAFDIFFQPSLWEAMSVVVLEAMAASKPVVATTVGENPHVIAHEADGLLVRPRDIDGMAAALIRVIDDPELRQRLGSAARRKVEQQGTVAHMARAYEQIYLDVLR